MDDRDPGLCKAFVAAGRAFLAAHPEVKHSWSIDADEDHCVLEMPKQAEDGFDLTVEVYPSQITVFAEGAHEHLDSGGDVRGTVGNALGLIRDLLSPSMGVREQRAAGTPYKWHIENLEQGAWNIESSTALMFWPYFGKRDECIYQNHILPARTPSDQPGDASDSESFPRR